MIRSVTSISLDAWRSSPAPTAAMGIVLEAGIRYERTMLEWAEWAIEELDRRAER